MPGQSRVRGWPCRHELPDRAPVRGARTPPAPVATASPAAAVAAVPTGPAHSVATPDSTGPDSVRLCWPVTPCAAVTGWTAPATRTGRVRPRPPWPITGRSPAVSWWPVAWTLTSLPVAVVYVPPAMPRPPPWTRGPEEGGTAHEPRRRRRPVGPHAHPRGGTLPPRNKAQATESRPGLVRFCRRPNLRPSGWCVSSAADRDRDELLDEIEQAADQIAAWTARWESLVRQAVERGVPQRRIAPHANVDQSTVSRLAARAHSPAAHRS